jgi:hypothetical protein
MRIRTLFIAALVVCYGYGAYRLGFGRAELQAKRTHYAELMSITSHLYSASKRGLADRVQESLGLETEVATLWYENVVPEYDRRRLSDDYSAAKDIAKEVEGRTGTNDWLRGVDGLWVIDRSRKKL